MFTYFINIWVIVVLKYIELEKINKKESFC